MTTHIEEKDKKSNWFAYLIFAVGGFAGFCAGLVYLSGIGVIPDVGIFNLAGVTEGVYTAFAKKLVSILAIVGAPFVLGTCAISGAAAFGEWFKVVERDKPEQDDDIFKGNRIKIKAAFLWLSRVLGVLAGITYAGVYVMGIFPPLGGELLFNSWPLSIGVLLATAIPAILIEIYLFSNAFERAFINAYKLLSKKNDQGEEISKTERAVNIAIFIVLFINAIITGIFIFAGFFIAANTLGLSDPAALAIAAPLGFLIGCGSLVFNYMYIPGFLKRLFHGDGGAGVKLSIRDFNPISLIRNGLRRLPQFLKVSSEGAFSFLVAFGVVAGTSGVLGAILGPALGFPIWASYLAGAIVGVFAGAYTYAYLMGEVEELLDDDKNANKRKWAAAIGVGVAIAAVVAVVGVILYGFVGFSIPSFNLPAFLPIALAVAAVFGFAAYVWQKCANAKEKEQDEEPVKKWPIVAIAAAAGLITLIGSAIGLGWQAMPLPELNIPFVAIAMIAAFIVAGAIAYMRQLKGEDDVADRLKRQGAKVEEPSWLSQKVSDLTGWFVPDTAMGQVMLAVGAGITALALGLLTFGPGAIPQIIPFDMLQEVVQIDAAAIAIGLAAIVGVSLFVSGILGAGIKEISKIVPSEAQLDKKYEAIELQEECGFKSSGYKQTLAMQLCGGIGNEASGKRKKAI